MVKTSVKMPKISVKRLKKELGQGGGKISTNWFFKFSIFCISEHAIRVLVEYCLYLMSFTLPLPFFKIFLSSFGGMSLFLV